MSIPVINFPPFRPYSNITPFTVRDGATYLTVLEELRNWLNATLVPHVDTEIANLVIAWEDNASTLLANVIAALNEQSDTVTAQLNEQNASILSQLNDQNAAITAQLAAQDANVTDQINTMTAYVDNAVQSIINSTIEVSDPVVLGVLNANGDSTQKVRDLSNEELDFAKGVAYGVATLDGSAKLPESQVPDRLSKAQLDIAASAMQNGAIGDGLSHPLSTKYTTLADAQVDYPAAESLTDETDWAAIQSTINTYGVCSLSANTTYVVNKPIVLSSNRLYGKGYRSEILMIADNVPIIDCVGSPFARVSVSGLKLRYQNYQPSTYVDANAIRLYNVMDGSSFRDIRIERCARGIYNSDNGFTYSTIFENISIGYYSISAIDISNNGGITGNVITNIYTHNNISGSPEIASNYPIILSGWNDGIISQLNIEHTIARGALLISNCTNLTINSLHIEGLIANLDWNGTIALVNSNTQVSISGLTIVYNTFTTSNIPSNTHGIVKMEGGTKIIVDNVDVLYNTIDITNPVLVYNDSSVTETKPAVAEFSNANIAGFLIMSSGSNTPIPTIKSYNNNSNWNKLGGKVTVSRSAIPTTGTWNVGDIVMNNNPTPGGPLGWVCTTAGTPGTWKSFGTIEL